VNQYAVLSDIHGNIWALEAVLADLARRGLQHLLNLGDSLYGPLEPQATADLLMGLPFFNIRGNQDRVLLESPTAPPSATFEYVLNDLSAASLSWLARQPASLEPGEVLFLCHGTPHSDETYLLEGLSPAGGFLREPEWIQAQLAGVTRPVVLCGHTHQPRAVQLSDGRLIVNPGSVGLPAYADDAPVAHKMESGSPHARYAILSETPGGWSVEQIALPYAWEKAAAQARRRGRNDWALWLESGRA